MKKIPLPYFFIAALAAVLWLPWLLAKGIFMDGLYDAIFAQNLAHCISDFWHPQTNDYSNPAYWDNPPLSMLTLSWFYKIFGDYYFIDKIYSLLCAIVQLFLLHFAWKIFWRNEPQIKKYSWLPALLWLISPLTSWSYSNNLMENTMSIFTTLSVISFLFFLRTKKYLLISSFAGAVFICLAFLTKGPVGFFPLAIPVLFILSERKEVKKLFAYAFLQFVFTAVLFGIVFSFPDAKNFLYEYYVHQISRALNHSVQGETSTNVIYIELPLMLLPLLIVYVITLFTLRRRNQCNAELSKALSFILAGLAASLPIALSMKQRKFYMLPSLPLYALGFSILVLPLVKFIEEKIENYRAEKFAWFAKYVCVAAIIICALLSIFNKNEFSRDNQMLADIEAALPIIKNEEAVCADWSLYGEWSLRSYHTRYYNKKIFMPDRISETKFYMTRHNQRGDKLPDDAEKIFSSETFDLYKISF